MAVPSPVGDSNTESSISILCEYLHNPTNSGREGTRKAPGDKIETKQLLYRTVLFTIFIDIEIFFFLAGGGGGVVNEVNCGIC